MTNTSYSALTERNKQVAAAIDRHSYAVPTASEALPPPAVLVTAAEKFVDAEWRREVAMEATDAANVAAEKAANIALTALAEERANELASAAEAAARQAAGEFAATGAPGRLIDELEALSRAKNAAEKAAADARRAKDDWVQPSLGGTSADDVEAAVSAALSEKEMAEAAEKAAAKASTEALTQFINASSVFSAEDGGSHPRRWAAKAAKAVLALRDAATEGGW